MTNTKPKNTIPFWKSKPSLLLTRDDTHFTHWLAPAPHSRHALSGPSTVHGTDGVPANCTVYAPINRCYGGMELRITDSEKVRRCVCEYKCLLVSPINSSHCIQENKAIVRKRGQILNGAGSVTAPSLWLLFCFAFP